MKVTTRYASLFCALVLATAGITVAREPAGEATTTPASTTAPSDGPATYADIINLLKQKGYRLDHETENADGIKYEWFAHADSDVRVMIESKDGQLITWSMSN